MHHALSPFIRGGGGLAFASKLEPAKKENENIIDK